jgi:hypothetical protein
VSGSADQAMVSRIQRNPLRSEHSVPSLNGASKRRRHHEAWGIFGGRAEADETGQRSHPPHLQNGTLK